MWAGILAILNLNDQEAKRLMTNSGGVQIKDVDLGRILTHLFTVALGILTLCTTENWSCTNLARYVDVFSAVVLLFACSRCTGYRPILDAFKVFAKTEPGAYTEEALAASKGATAPGACQKITSKVQNGKVQDKALLLPRTFLPVLPCSHTSPHIPSHTSTQRGPSEPQYSFVTF